MLEISQMIVLDSDIRFHKAKEKVKAGMLRNLWKHRKYIRDLWRKFCILFLKKYGK